MTRPRIACACSTSTAPRRTAATSRSPIPPLGYACLGSLATPGYDTPPPTSQIRCVHRRYLVRGKASLMWTDAGSLGFQDAGLWTCGDGAEGGLAARSFITRRHHSDPGYPKCWSLVADP